MSENREERRNRQREDFKKLITDRLDVLRVQVFDVLVLHLPPEVIADQSNGGLFAQAMEGAADVMAAARRPVVLLPEGTKLSAESVRPFLKELGVEVPEAVYTPPRTIATPTGLHAVPDLPEEPE